jgi:hypothetical protein
VIVKSGIKTWTMLSGLVLALVLVTGCNSGDEPAATGGGAPAPAVAPATKAPDAKAPMTPPASKPDEK